MERRTREGKREEERPRNEEGQLAAVTISPTSSIMYTPHSASNVEQSCGF